MEVRDKINALMRAVSVYPGLRLGQLLTVAAHSGGGWADEDLFNCPDELMVRGLGNYFNMAQDMRENWPEEEVPDDVQREPFVCLWLGVKPGERFKISGFGTATTFRVLEDGTFETSPCNAIGSSIAFLRAIESPDLIIHLPGWTRQDADDAKAALRSWPDAETVTRYKLPEDDDYCVRVESRSKTYGWLHKRTFPSIEPGKSYRLDDIIAGGSTA